MALIMAILALVLLSILAGGFMVSSITERKMAMYQHENMACVQLADAGIAKTLEWLGQQDPPPCAMSGTYDLGSAQVATCGSTHPTISFAATNDCSDEYIGWEYTIMSQGITPDGTDCRAQVDVTVRKETPACYLQVVCCAVNAEYWDMDVLRGPIMANEPLKFKDSPLFPWKGARLYGKVSTAADNFHCTGGDMTLPCPLQAATLYDTYETNVDGINCDLNFPAAISCADAGGYHWNYGKTAIELNSDGTITVTNLTHSPHFDHVNMPIPNSKVIFVDGNGARGTVHVSGTLNGQLTIIAGTAIVVDGDILYNNDPRFDPQSTDMLGLLTGACQPSRGNLNIPDLIPHAPDGDRQIFGYWASTSCHGTLWCESATSGPREGTLIIYGSAFQGWLRATEPSSAASGWALDLTFDSRACYGTQGPPPCFPELETDEGRIKWAVSRHEQSWKEVY